MSERISIAQIAIVTRITPLDFDMREYGANSAEELMQKYLAEGKSEPAAKRMLADKENRSREQKRFLEELIETHRFRPEQIIRIDDWLLKEKIKEYKAAISFGGDDTQTRVSHAIGSIPLIGLKADTTSLGKVLYYNKDNFRQALERIQKGEYAIEEWPRLEACIDGAQFAQAMSQYCLSAPFSNKHMSRFTLYKGSILLSPKEGVPGSGVIVWTGIGSTGQARSATWYLGEQIAPFKPSERKAMWAVKEPYSPDKHPFEEYGLSALCGELKEGEELVLVSRCKTIDQLIRSLKLKPGSITADALEDEFFKEGTEVRIKISENPLRIIYVQGIAIKNDAQTRGKRFK